MIKIVAISILLGIYFTLFSFKVPKLEVSSKTSINPHLGINENLDSDENKLEGLNMAKEYSYYLAYVDSKGEIFGNASGFLLKKGNQSFLVTNVHVLFGIHVVDLSPQKELEKYGNFKIMVRYRTEHGEWELFDIEIDKHRESLKKALFPKMLDIFSYRLPELPSNGIFYYINEDFELDQTPICDRIEAIGYPAMDHFTVPTYKKRECKVSFGNTIGPILEKGRRINTNLFIEKGMSGCPIFSIRNEEGIKKVKFFGIGDGYNPENGESFITYIAGSDTFKEYFN